MRPTSEWFREAPLVIAHRGASSRAPENTIEAFRLAAELGADAVELDAKLSADGRVFVFHDQTLDRLAGLPGRPGDRTWVELQRLDVGSWKSPAYRGARIPLLEEVLEEVGNRLLVNIELTNYPSPNDDLVERAIEVVKAAGMTARVLFSSFFRSNLKRARALAPDIALAHLVGPTRLGAIDVLHGPRVESDALNVYQGMVTRWLVRRTQRQGRRVFVYTVNHIARLRAMWALGADGVITDKPDLAIESLRHAT
ncbi:MAG TPA: glycerophosphodiester phosphodiesterase family protein [Anaerolineales bacterium]|nr:glycerophosphodiester phosphodiesterase family protein [Anaerolineales bacterium]